MIKLCKINKHRIKDGKETDLSVLEDRELMGPTVADALGGPKPVRLVVTGNR